MLQKGFLCAFALTILAVSAPAGAAPIAVGGGTNHATVLINWGDGAIREFDVAFSTASITGLEAFDIIEADTSLTTVRDDFGFGVFIDGITLGTHSDIGWAGGENWWHFWIKDSGQSWTAPPYGVADRVLTDGDADGWVYGNADAPLVPEPATMTLLLTGAVAILCRRKRAV